LYKLTEKNLKEDIDPIISQPIYNMQDNFWEKIREGYTNSVKQYEDKC
jgi:hypothetical protein